MFIGIFSVQCQLPEKQVIDTVPYFTLEDKTGLKEGLKRGSAASARLWLEIFEVLPNKRQRKLTAALIKKIMAIVKPFVEPSKLPELATRLAKAVDD